MNDATAIRMPRQPRMSPGRLAIRDAMLFADRPLSMRDLCLALRSRSGIVAPQLLRGERAGLWHRVSQRRPLRYVLTQPPLPLDPDPLDSPVAPPVPAMLVPDDYVADLLAAVRALTDAVQRLEILLDAKQAAHD